MINGERRDLSTMATHSSTVINHSFKPFSPERRWCRLTWRPFNNMCTTKARVRRVSRITELTACAVSFSGSCHSRTRNRGSKIAVQEYQHSDFHPAAILGSDSHRRAPKCRLLLAPPERARRWTFLKIATSSCNPGPVRSTCTSSRARRNLLRESVLEPGLYDWRLRLHASLSFFPRWRAPSPRSIRLPLSRRDILRGCPPYDIMRHELPPHPTPLRNLRDTEIDRNRATNAGGKQPMFSSRRAPDFEKSKSFNAFSSMESFGVVCD